MSKEQQIREALAALDPSNDDHWTGDGLPRIDLVNKGIAGTAKREEITDAAPGFTRETPTLPSAEVSQHQEETKVEDDGASQDPDLGDEDEGGDPDLEDPDLEDPDLGDEDEDDDLEVSVEKAEAVVAKAERELAQARRKAQEAQRKRDEAIAREGKRNNSRESQLAISAYLKRQNEVREEQSNRARALAEAGFTPEMLRTGSKLDNSMQRKTGHGNDRPLPRNPNGGQDQ